MDHEEPAQEVANRGDGDDGRRGGDGVERRESGAVGHTDRRRSAHMSVGGGERDTPATNRGANTAGGPGPRMEPILVYDDDCGFCTWWADWIDERTDIRLVGFSELTAELRERLPDDYEACAHLVTDESVYSCGAAIEQALVRVDAAVDADPVVDFLRQFEDYERFRERAYRWAADRRDKLGLVVSKTPPARRNGSDD
jgi:predicted DCC family thiol-disulfide oxidoreductase YuxK